MAVKREAMAPPVQLSATESVSIRSISNLCTRFSGFDSQQEVVSASAASSARILFMVGFVIFR